MKVTCSICKKDCYANVGVVAYVVCDTCGKTVCASCLKEHLTDKGTCAPTDALNTEDVICEYCFSSGSPNEPWYVRCASCNAAFCNDCAKDTDVFNSGFCADCFVLYRQRTYLEQIKASLDEYAKKVGVTAHTDKNKDLLTALTYMVDLLALE